MKSIYTHHSAFFPSPAERALGISLTPCDVDKLLIRRFANHDKLCPSLLLLTMPRKPIGGFRARTLGWAEDLEIQLALRDRFQGSRRGRLAGHVGEHDLPGGPSAGSGSRRSPPRFRGY